MLQSLAHLRFMNLFYHQAHNTAARVPFFADHEAFGSFYAEMDSDYDSVAERMIGKGMDFTLEEVMMPVMEKMSNLPPSMGDNKAMFAYGLQLEEQLLRIIDEYIAKGVSEGTRQMLGDIADRTEIRIYKIKQRIK